MRATADGTNTASSSSVISVDHHHATRTTGHDHTPTATTSPQNRPAITASRNAINALVNAANIPAATTPATTHTPTKAIRAFRAYDCDTGVSTRVTAPTGRAPNRLPFAM